MKPAFKLKLLALKPVKRCGDCQGPIFKGEIIIIEEDEIGLFDSYQVCILCTKWLKRDEVTGSIFIRTG